MKIKDYIYILIILLLAFYIWYIKQNNITLDELPNYGMAATIKGFQNEPVTTDKISLLKELDESYTFTSLLNSSVANAPDTERISPTTAIDLHSTYINDISNANHPDTIRGVLFKLPLLIKSIMEAYNIDEIEDPDIDLRDAGIYVYFGRYSNAGKFAYQSTAMIQIANVAEDTVFTNMIFDLGDLCPNNCPSNENIKL